MSKVLPKISPPGSVKFPTKGPHNPNVGTSGSGIAPRPSTKQGLLSQSGASAASQAGLARVKGAGTGNSGMRLPVQSPKANISGQAQPIQSGAKAPAPRGGPAGLRAGGRNQAWPNGALYTDASKKGGHARGGELQKAASRKKKGAPFFGEWPS